jgi:hypothetical protein
MIFQNIRFALPVARLDLVDLYTQPIPMKAIRLILFLALVFSTVTGTSGQGTMLYLNGKEKRFTTAEIKGDFIVYKPEGSQQEGVKKLEKFDIFSLRFDNGTEQIIYEPDTSYGDPTVEQARDYIKGEQLADSIYKKPLNMIGGIATGAAGSLLLFYGPIVPALYATTISLFTPKIPQEEKEREIRSIDFIAGYERKARNKKTKNALIGGAIGFSVGIGVLLIINN